MPPRKKLGWVRKPVFIGIFAGSVFSGQASRKHKKAGVVLRKKIHAAGSTDQVESGSCRVPQGSRTPPVIGSAHAGPSSMNGFHRTPVAGRPTASLPVRAQCTRAARTRQARMFLPRKGSLAGDWSAPEKLDIKVVGMQRGVPFQFLASLLRLRGGWFAHAGWGARCRLKRIVPAWLSLARHLSFPIGTVFGVEIDAGNARAMYCPGTRQTDV